ncbi:hypothetical protein BDV40DRAFT_258347 [Aspergillus tamarii]|uniref:Uncharacterized protein n=1 Tax=Aspergillus tamarii TaxID=41984 RepID=A0A5N6V2S5_ASPTM|nr:hypothetical protein BDV40DRAFT_258347 [Aspergillus tamarii]
MTSGPSAAAMNLVRGLLGELSFLHLDYPLPPWLSWVLCVPVCVDSFFLFFY